MEERKLLYSRQRSARDLVKNRNHIEYETKLYSAREEMRNGFDQSVLEELLRQAFYNKWTNEVEAQITFEGLRLYSCYISSSEIKWTRLVTQFGLVFICSPIKVIFWVVGYTFKRSYNNLVYDFLFNKYSYLYYYLLLNY